MFTITLMSTKSVSHNNIHAPLVVYMSDAPVFSADEVTAVALLRMLFPKVTVVSCDGLPPVTASNYLFLNFGRVYNPDQKRYDKANSTAVFSSKYKLRMGSCGMIWKQYGRYIIQKLGGQDDDGYIYDTIYNDLLRVIENTADLMHNMPASFVLLVNSFNAISDTDKGGNFHTAVAAAEPLIIRAIHAQILRANIYLQELSILERAFETRTHEYILVLPTICNSVLLFLAENDRMHEVEFVIQPRDANADTWQVWVMGDVPLMNQNMAENILRDRLKYIAKSYKLAVTHTRSSAIWLAENSYYVHYSVWNYPFRVWNYLVPA